MKTYKQLLEEVKEQDRIPVPDRLRFPPVGKYRKFIEEIVSKIESYHRTTDEDDLKRTTTLSLRVIEQLLDDMTEQELNHRHQVRILKSKLSSYISIKKSKENDDDPEII